jgi:hypothetical protein
VLVSCSKPHSHQGATWPTGCARHWPATISGFRLEKEDRQNPRAAAVLPRDRDDIIPLKLGRSLFEVAAEPKGFIEIPGAGHNDLVERAGSSYRERLHEFYGHLQ